MIIHNPSTAIMGFDGEYRWLSNFWPCITRYDGIEYSTTEHAYQAAKTLNEAQRRAIASLRYPGQAKKFSRTLELRSNWENMKYNVMQELLSQKFSYPILAQKLIDSGNREIIEYNTWGDTYWGVICNRDGDYIGENRLGNLLMEIREIIQ